MTSNLITQRHVRCTPPTVGPSKVPPTWLANAANSVLAVPERPNQVDVASTQDASLLVTSSQTLLGVKGRLRGSAPNEVNAWATAFARAPPAAMMPPSPAPLTPSGLFGDG